MVGPVLLLLATCTKTGPAAENVVKQ